MRRGRFLTYEQLRRTFGSDTNIDIIWDRRRPMNMLASASAAPVERRGRPPLEWARLDYLITSGNRPNNAVEPPAP